MRMLDNVIDINFYTIPEARRSNLRHRPVGLGIMGLSGCALDRCAFRLRRRRPCVCRQEHGGNISFHAISASVDLAAERGRYPTLRRFALVEGHSCRSTPSNCSQDSRDGTRCSIVPSKLDWDRLRETGHRPSACATPTSMAIAPTATISNICGVSQSIEPTYQNLFVKSNMSGDFTVVNAALIRDLKTRGLWDEVMVSDLKYFDGTRRPDRPRSGRPEGALRHLLRDRARPG